MTKKRSINRFQARELEQKIIPSIKILSKHMHNTAPDVPTKDFHGYKVPSGTFTDGHGKEWQVQVHAYCTKSHFIKDNEIKPIIRKGAIMFRVRLFMSILTEKIMNW